MSGSTKQTNFGSRLGFILASAGSAVGLGAIWKFPYMAGTNGGAVFMLPYIFFTVTVGMALLLAEFAMGRAGRSGPVGSLNNVCGKPWGIFGGIGKVEYRAEEYEMIPTYQRHPLRPVRINDREIEHIHHLSVEQRSISSAFRQE